MLSVIEEKNLIPIYQFGFRQKHGTINQVHKLINKILQSFEKKEYYLSF